MTDDKIFNHTIKQILLGYKQGDIELDSAIDGVLQYHKMLVDRAERSAASTVRNTVLWCIDSTRKRPAKTVLKLLENALAGEELTK